MADEFAHSAPKGGAAARWFAGHLGRITGALFLAFASLVAAQQPQISSKPVATSERASLNARGNVLGARPLAMYYYSPDSPGLKSLEQHASQMTLVSPQTFWADAEGFVHGEAPSELLATARRAKIAVMPLVVNPGFDRRVASALLRSPRAQQRAVTYLAYLAQRDNFVGWQLDLEYIDPEDKGYYTEFVQRAAARLHREGKLLSIAVVPRFSDVYPDSNPAQEFHGGEWGAPYDFRALGRVVDFMTLMTYDHHNGATPPGPVAGYDWVKAALDYTTRRVPGQKVLLGIPFYGREWIERGSTTSARTLTFAEAQDRMQQLRLERLWDARWHTPWFQYSDDSGLHTAWFEDSKSLESKLELMRKYHLRGFAAWRLGVEDPGFWSLAAGKRRTGPERHGHTQGQRPSAGGPPENR